MIDQINQTQNAHIITIEDPIEFLIRDRKSILSQRELGLDTTTFASALKSALRQDPDDQQARENLQKAMRLNLKNCCAPR